MKLRTLFAEKRKLFWLLAALTLALDLASKEALWSPPEAGRPDIVLIPNLLRFISHAGNTQGALGLGPQSPGFFICAALVGLGLLGFFLITTPPGHGLAHAALGMLSGGAVGNLVDRASLWFVRDFIDLHWKDVYHWHTFNVADAAICIGFGMILYDSFVLRRRAPEGASEAEAE